MKILVLLPFIILSLINLNFYFLQMDDDSGTKISNMEYGQLPPGRTPVLFSPEFIKTKHRIHSSPTFSPELNEVYWSVFFSPSYG